jgi:4-amino-4-deoxy-L-arabinose transferase-like glycosyltransferase
MIPASGRLTQIHPVNRAAAAILAAGLLITSILAILPALGKPFTLDETEIALRAHFILEKGPKTFLDGTHYIAHPLLYEYTMAGVFKLFGESEVPARSFGLIIFILTGLLFLLTVRELLRSEDPLLRRAAVFIGMLFYFVNPLLLQHGLELDADTMGTSLFVMAFAYFYIRMEMRDGVRQWPMRVAQALAIAFAFLCKEITPIFIFSGVLIYRTAGRQWKKLLEDTAAVFIGGTLLAWLAWWTYCAFTGTDVMAFLKYTLLKKTSRALNPEFLKRVFAGLEHIIRWPLYWMSAPFFVLLTLTFFRRIIQFFQTGRTRPEDALFVIAWVVWVPYLLVKGSIDMMKYQHPIYPLFMAAILCGCVAAIRPRAEDLAAALRDAWWILPLIAAVILGLTFYYANIGDYLKFMWDQPYNPRFKNFLNLYYRPLAVGAGAAVVLWVLGRLKLIEGIVAASLLFVFPVNAALNLNQTAEYTTAESWMNYGESGLKDTVEYLALIVRPGSTVAVRDDILYYLEMRKNIKGLKAPRLRDLLISRNLPELNQYFASGILEVVVVDRISLLGLTPQNSAPGTTLFSARYYLDRQIGDFKVYRPRKR